MANFSKSFNFRNGLQVDDDKLIVKPNTGLVGIGSTVPTEVLDVEGNIKSSGTVNSTNVEVGTGITVGINSAIKLDGGSGRITATEYIGDGSTLTNVVAIATAGFKELSGTLSTTSSVGIGSENVGGQFPDFTLDVVGDVRVTGPSSFIGITTISDLFADTLSVSNSSTFAGGATIDQANVTGVSTFTGISTNTSLIQANGLSVAGVSTFIDAVNFRGDGIVKFGQPYGNSPSGSSVIFYGGHSTGRNITVDSGNLVFDDMAKARFGNTIVGGLIPDLEIYWNGARGILKHWGGLSILSYGKGDVIIDSGLSVVGVSTLRSLEVSGVSTFSNSVGINTNFNVTGTSTFNGAIDANAGATLNQLNVTGVSTLTGRLTATEINSASSNVVRLLQSGTQVFNTIGAGVSVSNTLKIGSLNGGTSGLSTHDATLIYGNESGANAFMTRRSFNILNNDTGNFNYFLNINNLKDSGIDRTGNFVWHKASNPLMTLTGIGGSLGIGVTTPSAALEVVGGATLGGTVNMGGNVTINNLNLTGALTGDLTGNVVGIVTGNLFGNVISSGISTLPDILANNIGIATVRRDDRPININSETATQVFVDDDGRIGIKTDNFPNLSSSYAVGVFGDAQIHGGISIGNTDIPRSSVDFSDVVNVPSNSAVDRAKTAYLLPPRVTTTQRDALYNGYTQSGDPVAGAFIFNVTNERLELYDGNGWVGLATVA